LAHYVQLSLSPEAQVPELLIPSNFASLLDALAENAHFHVGKSDPASYHKVKKKGDKF
jgi:hypothetical protein